MKTKSLFARSIYLLIVFIFLATLFVPAASAQTGASNQYSSYIVQGTNVDVVVELVERYGGTVTSRLEIINGVGATLSQASLLIAGSPAAPR